MSHRGFTLIELMLSVSLFLVIMLAATALFSRTADTQGKALAIKNLQEGSDYALQFIKREAETAKQGLDGCGFPCGGVNDYFCTSGANNDHLYLRNKNDECVHYFLQTDSNGVQRLAVTRNNLPLAPYYTYITPADVTIIGLKFGTAALMSDPNFISGRLTMFISARPSDGTAVDSLNLQTSIAVRPFVCGQTIYDRDNFDYKTILIGDQCWLAENLKTRRMTNGNCINTPTGPYTLTSDCLTINSGVANGNGGFDTSARDCILSSGNARGPETDCKRGYALYTFSAMMEGSTTEGAQGICPRGWHIPTADDITELVDNFGGYFNAGDDLKVNGGSGFEALLPGFRSTTGSTFVSSGSIGAFWTSNLAFFGWPKHIRVAAGTGISEVYGDPTTFTSLTVRCLKN